jgi:hypothetical protein
MRFRPLSLDPFTDIGRTIPEFSSFGLAESKEFHGFSVDKNNVFEIDAFFGSPSLYLLQFCAKPRHSTIPNRVNWGDWIVGTRFTVPGARSLTLSRYKS